MWYFIHESNNKNFKFYIADPFDLIYYSVLIMGVGYIIYTIAFDLKKGGGHMAYIYIYTVYIFHSGRFIPLSLLLAANTHVIWALINHIIYTASPAGSCFLNHIIYTGPESCYHQSNIYTVCGA